MNRWRTVVIGLLLLSLTLHMTALAQQDDSPLIRVGSKSFPENVILGKMMLIVLEEAGFDVEDLTNLGTTDNNREALLNGQIDIYPEYTGTAYTNFFRGVEWLNYSDTVASNQYATHAEVSMVDAVLYDLVWLTPAPANNSFAIALRRQFAEANNLRTLSDFATFVNGGGEIRFVTDETFSQRPDGLGAFEAAYGFDLAGSQVIVISGIDSTITEQAVRDGVNEINAGVAFGTDGTLQAFDLIILEDDLNALPVYQPAPVIRGSVIRAHPEIAALFRPIFLSLDTATLQGLNAQVQVEGVAPDVVARAYLEQRGFIGASGG